MTIYEENMIRVQTILKQGIGILKENYTVRKLDAGEFESIITSGTNFRIAHYEIENVGHLMTMHTEDNPQMQLATFTIVPFYKKLPLLSSDFMYYGDDGIFLIEIYELVINRKDEQFQEWIRKYDENFKDISDIEDNPTKSCFYDSIRPVFASKKRNPSRDLASIQNMIDTLKIFIEQEHASEFLDEREAAEQKAIQSQYVDDLIDQSGISTSIWVEEHGQDYVRRFYHEVFFSV